MRYLSQDSTYRQPQPDIRSLHELSTWVVATLELDYEHDQEAKDQREELNALEHVVAETFEGPGHGLQDQEEHRCDAADEQLRSRSGFHDEQEQAVAALTVGLR